MRAGIRVSVHAGERDEPRCVLGIDRVGTQENEGGRGACRGRRG